MKPSRKSNKSTTNDTLGDDGDEYGVKNVVKPDDQLVLTETELKEEITRVLTANNPHAPQNTIRFNFKDGVYRSVPNIEQTSVSFWLEGSLLHKDSDEAKRQQSGTILDDELGDEADDQSGVASVAKEKKLANQFNFCERSSQTFNNALRERGNVTEPPPRATYSGQATQWIMFDDYAKDFAQHQADKTEEKKAHAPGARAKDVKAHHLKKHLGGGDNQTAGSADLRKLSNELRIMERMINQNTFDDIAQDFKYYEDRSDDYKEQNGTLLPLWKFSNHRGKKLAVTTLRWSPTYSDLFAVGYGSYDFTRQGAGMVCFFSLKNPGFPEYIFTTHSGVMSIDIHPQMSQLFCVGFYDGSVAVYNVKQQHSTPLFISTAKTGKHTEPVWDIRWIPGQPESKTLHFISISADGRVTSWTIMKVFTISDPGCSRQTRRVAGELAETEGFSKFDQTVWV